MKRDPNGQVNLGKWELLIQIVILLCLVDFAVETLPDLTDQQRFWVNAFEIFSGAIFTAEYAIRFWFSRPRRSYPLSFFGIIDLLAILPFIIGLGIDLKSLRALRLLRFFRVIKLARYSAAARRFHRAFVISKEEIILFFTTACILLYLAAMGIYHFEHEAQPEVFASMFDGLWWAVATLTTVGYGDCYPITAGGKFFTFVILLIGLGIIAVPSGMVAAALGKARQEEREEGKGETSDEE
ncbi:MAG: ion transporter [Verrucomicrobiales bacterium]